MDIIYANSEEQHIETLLKEISQKRSSIITSFITRVIVALIFGALCLSKFNFDNEIYGYLREDSSFVILVYIICGLLWIVILPVFLWKIKSVLIIRQIQQNKIKFEGEIKIGLSQDLLTIATQSVDIKSPWQNVLKVTAKRGFIALEIRGFERFLIPTEAFKSEEESTSFINYINEKIQPVDENEISGEGEV